MKLTSLLEFVDKLQQAGKIENLQNVCGVFSCVHIYQQVKKALKISILCLQCRQCYPAVQ